MTMILIDLEALPNIYMATRQELIMALEATPEVDAVPVIRCKDCKHHYKGRCVCWEYISTADDYFCKDEERKEE